MQNITPFYYVLGGSIDYISYFFSQVFKVIVNNIKKLLVFKIKINIFLKFSNIIFVIIFDICHF